MMHASLYVTYMRPYAFAFRRAHSEIPRAVQGVVRLRRGSAPRDILALPVCSPAIMRYAAATHRGAFGAQRSEERYGIRTYGGLIVNTNKAVMRK